MTEETQAVCGAALSLCSFTVSHLLAWAPLLSVIAMIVAIVSGGFAIAVSIRRLRDK